MKNLLIYSMIGWLLIACNPPVSKFEIDAGNYDRKDVPITITTSKNLNPQKSYYLRNITNVRSYPVQVMSENSLFFVLDELAAGTKNEFELIEGAVEITFPDIRLEEDSVGVQALVGNYPVFFYHIATAFPPDTLPEYYKRSGFIHPLQSPNGEILTDDFPAGHAHQHGIFNAWTNTTFKGEKVDFWNQQQELGTVAHEAIISKNEGALVGELVTKLNHISLAHGPVLEEQWHITVYPMMDYYLFDLTSEQTNTTVDTLYINEYHYGGMAFRGSKEWNKDDTIHFTNTWKILTSQGLGVEEANHTEAKWVDASGLVNGKEVGAAVFGFPENFRYPQTIRVHPTMPYWVYSPMVKGAFYIAPGQKYISKFRYYVHNGSPDQAVLESIQNDLENPVTVKEY